MYAVLIHLIIIFGKSANRGSAGIIYKQQPDLENTRKNIFYSAVQPAQNLKVYSVVSGARVDC